MPAPTTAVPGRGRTVTALFGGVGLSTAAYLAMITIAPLVAEDLLGSARWSGVPSTVAILGGAIGTTLLARLMARRGRFTGLIAGYLVGAAAAGVAALATMGGSTPLFLAAMSCIGVGAGAHRLARYASADLFPVERRAASISWMVWGGTIGSVAGPTLLEPSRALAAGLGMAGAAGPFLLGMTAIGGAALLLAGVGDRRLLCGVTERTTATHEAARELLRIPRVRLALVAMVVGQIVMVLIMTMTPIHVRSTGHGLTSIGLVISAHTFGMYALSPVSGMLSDRAGRIPILLIGSCLLMASGVLAASAGASQNQLVLALFLLGLGWNFGFVAGSALLTDDAPLAMRIQLQGVADSVVWGSGALASLSSGLLLAGWGYPTLSLAGATLAAVPMLAIVGYTIANREVPRSLRPETSARSE